METGLVTGCHLSEWLRRLMNNTCFPLKSISKVYFSLFVLKSEKTQTCMENELGGLTFDTTQVTLTQLGLRDGPARRL